MKTFKSVSVSEARILQGYARILDKRNVLQQSGICFCKGS